MQIIADLQLHSKYSRAVSQKMDLTEIATWSAKKGIQLVATGDWTHPLWFREIKTKLKETSPGIYALKVETGHAPSLQSVKFLLSTEISSIYVQGGKQRRVHNLIFSPSIETCDKIIKELQRRGANLMADGRPIVGISSKNLLEMVLTIDKNVLFIPAHCLIPEELIETKSGLKKISSIKKNDLVLSHTGKYQKVLDVLKRKTNENIYTITPWCYTQSISTTGEHPFFAIKTLKKCPSTGDTCLPFGEHPKRCVNKLYKNYRLSWIQAKDLNTRDLICFPLIKEVKNQKSIKIADKKIEIDKNFCLLIGYFLAEGCVDHKGGITFTFSSKEISYTNEVIQLMKKVFGIFHVRIYSRKNIKSKELIFYSKATARFLEENFYINNNYRSYNKTLPNWIITLPKNLQKYLILGWFRGDAGYTTSINLVSSFNKILLRLGIIPYISLDKKIRYNQRKSHVYNGRTIKANYDSYQIRLSFISDTENLKQEKQFQHFQSKITRRHGFIDNNFVYLPIRKIIKNKYQGEVFNLEVENDNSYSTWVATIHNCWTPWFSIFGSKSGFDSIEECFGELADNIYAIETGLSSDPIMNWQIKELENRSIVSFSDAHSGPKLGREATVFVSNIKHATLNNFSYLDISDAIRRNPNGKLKIGYTIEFFPEEGKYHWSGHRSHNIRYTPQEVKEKGTICPVCHQPLTIGVENRVIDLSYKTLSSNDLEFVKNGVGLTFVYDKDKKRRPFVSLIPLLEVLTETTGGSHIKALREYERLTSTFATEFEILLKKTYEEIEKKAGKELRDGVEIVRERKVFVDPGYDGVFGIVKIFKDEKGQKTEEKETTQQSLF
ncbi:hypothetical protein HY357_02890 [Candidatus Roizmanbacteria bacterium]|nr:hypothetical protein [Candidatus Roizmanbacteria bacterium]